MHQVHLGMSMERQIEESKKRRDAWAESEYAEQVRMNDHDVWSRRFNGWVLIRHQDGSSFLMNQAFLVLDRDDERFMWVFTEHHGRFLFVVAELDMYRELTS